MRHRLILLGLVALALPAHAEIVFESRDPKSTSVELEPGDRLLSWRGAEGSERGAPFEHWWQLELVSRIEPAKGPTFVDFMRDGAAKSIQLPASTTLLRAHPVMAGDLAGRLLADLDPAAPQDDAVRQSVESFGGIEVASWSLTRLADALVKTGDRAGAKRAYLDAIAITPAPFTGELQSRLGRLLEGMGRLDEAEAAFQAGLEIWQAEAGEGLGESFPLVALANLRSRVFDWSSAEALYQESCNLRRRIAPRSWLEVQCELSLGVKAGRRNDLARAESHFHAALELSRELGQDVESVLNNLGIVARLRGDFERAEAYQSESIESSLTAGNSRAATGGMINLANTVADGGDLARAVALYGSALAIRRESGASPDDVAFVLLNRGKTYRLQGDFEAAKADLLGAKALWGFETPRTGPENTTMEILAEIDFERGYYGPAASRFEIVLDFWASSRPDSSYEALTASSLATARLAMGGRTEAEAAFKRSIDAIEKQQLRLGGGDRGLVAFRSKFAGIYRAYIRYLLSEGRNDEAFELYERSRAQALRALLGGRDLDFVGAAGDQKLLRERKLLGREIEGAYRGLMRLPSDATDERREQQLSLERLHGERDALSLRIRGTSPRIAAAEAPPVLARSEMQAGLKEGTLLLSYFLGPEGSILFTLDRRRGLQVHPIEAGHAEIEASVERWVELVTRPRPSRELDARAQELTEWLLGPVTDRIEAARRVVIVPDGALHRLSFAALNDPSNPTRRFVEALPIARDVSASVFVERRFRELDSRTTRVAVFADPTSTGGAAERFGELKALPSTRAEAAAVQRIFGDEASIYVGEQATETALRQALTSATITHFAGHAVIDEKLPLDSSLVLATSGEEGLLQAWEIAEQLELASDLVVLSACDTARGGARTGEGIVGLVRALQIAGAGSVVASLWRVGDESTAALMSRFYAELAAGTSRDEALRTAQLALLQGLVEVERDGQTIRIDASRPRHWAPFVLLGSVQ